jgi:hypothetical protein
VDQKMTRPARPFLKRSSRTNSVRELLFAGMSVIVMCFGDPRVALSQSEHKPPIEASLLPPTTGGPLTIKPLDLQDIDCIVAEWRSSAARPVLTLICPPSSVFSPLRVLIKLSWMKPEDLLVSPEHILAPPGTPTKIRTNKTAAQIRLPVNENGKSRDTWIGFTAVVDVALLKGRPK